MFVNSVSSRFHDGTMQVKSQGRSARSRGGDTAAPLRGSLSSHNMYSNINNANSNLNSKARIQKTSPSKSGQTSWIVKAKQASKNGVHHAQTSLGIGVVHPEYPEGFHVIMQ